MPSMGILQKINGKINADDDKHAKNLSEMRLKFLKLLWILQKTCNKDFFATNLSAHMFI